MVLLMAGIPLQAETKSPYSELIATLPDEDSDGDGLTNAEEGISETNPTNPDCDGDGVLDGADGWAWEPALSPPRLPEVQYAVIDLDPVAGSYTYSSMIGLSDDNTVLFAGSDENSLNCSYDYLYAIGHSWNPIRGTVSLDFCPHSISRSGQYVCGEKYAFKDDGWGLGNLIRDYSAPVKLYKKDLWSGAKIPLSWTKYGFPGLNGEPNPDFDEEDASATSVNSSGTTVGYFIDWRREAHPYPSDPNHMAMNWWGISCSGFDFTANTCLDGYARLSRTITFEEPTGSAGPIFIADELSDDGVAAGRASFTKPSSLSPSGLSGSSNFFTTDIRFAAIHHPPSTIQVLLPEMSSEFPIYSTAVGLNSAVPKRGVISSHFTNGITTPKLWLFSGTNAPAEYPIARGPGGQAISLTSYPYDINDRFEITGDFGLIRNGRLTLPKASNSDWTVKLSQFVNNSGIIAGYATYQQDATWRHGLLVSADIVPDYNRDGVIDNKDRGKVTEQKPWRWWINDDDDEGDVFSGLEYDDEPEQIYSGQSVTPDMNHEGVDGRRDLLDFAPLWLDIRKLVDVLPPDSYTYKFRQEEAAINVVFTDLVKSDAGKFLNQDYTTNFGSDFTNPPQSANTVQVTSAGSEIPTAFLNKIKTDENKGIILVEGAAKSTKPLVLAVYKGSDKIAEFFFQINIDGVEKMYRWVNLRGVAGQSEIRGTDTSEPTNYPDKNTNGKMFVFVHGYNVSEHQSRGWCAEAFKRLYQTGSKAMFTGVSWHGDSSQIPGWVPVVGGNSLDYWENVTHAFQTSQALAPIVNNLPGSSKTIAAHSLGNMVVSNAIKEHSMAVAHYFLFDAAVAIEASAQSALNIAEMREPTWQSYDQRLWASNWYQRFESSDGRNKLTWRDRFGSIAGAYNFFSSGEDVLNNATGTVPGIGAERAWALQEMIKGTGHLGALASLDSNGGWGFNSNWDNIIGMDPNTGMPITVRRTPAETDTITNDELKTQPFFKLFQDGRLVTANQGSAAANEYLTRAKVLGDAIPALSFAAGRNPVLGFEDRNVDLMTMTNDDEAWPQARLSDPTKVTPEGKGRWLHGDAKDVAYRYNYLLWKNWVNLGGLK